MGSLHRSPEPCSRTCRQETLNNVMFVMPPFSSAQDDCLYIFLWLVSPRSKLRLVSPRSNLRESDEVVAYPRRPFLYLSKDACSGGYMPRIASDEKPRAFVRVLDLMPRRRGSGFAGVAHLRPRSTREIPFDNFRLPSIDRHVGLPRFRHSPQAVFQLCAFTRKHGLHVFLQVAMIEGNHSKRLGTHSERLGLLEVVSRRRHSLYRMRCRPRNSERLSSPKPRQSRAAC